jgi:tripartite-type tricarboxylate transporter receptor subunit TctC
MNDAQNQRRRRFLRTSLTAAGVLATPWGLLPAQAAVPGRMVVSFQMPSERMRFTQILLDELHSRYQPDLGSRPVIIPGGAGRVAIETVSRSDPDGATVLIAPSTMLSLVPIIMKPASDPADTLIPVAGIGELVLTFSVGPSVPAQVRTMADYVEWVRSNPRQNSYGVPGLGTATHYVGAEVSRLADVQLRVAGYRGSAAIIEDIATGKIPAGIFPPTGQEDNGRFPQMRVLAVTGERRFPLLPDVPTLLECGLGEPLPTESMGLYLPQGTPDQKVQELAAAVQAVTASPALAAAMWSVGMAPMAFATESYAHKIAAERATWRMLVTRHDFAAGT